MASKDHYVSQFHLKMFTEPDSKGLDPWLWVGDCYTFEVGRRAPKNLAWKRGLFSAPGGLADRDSCLEDYIAREIEGPAATAFREFAVLEVGASGEIPTPILRYVAWAAARSLPMRSIYENWAAQAITTKPNPETAKLLGGTATVPGTVRMVHDTFGAYDVSDPDEAEKLRQSGWRPEFSDHNFAELVHLQAFFFQVKHFPKMNWAVLGTPPNGSFVISDRPVVWGVRGGLELTPAALAHPACQLFAPLTRSKTLFAFHGRLPSAPKPQEINAVMAAAAHSWVAGASRDIVFRALQDGRALAIQESP